MPIATGLALGLGLGAAAIGAGGSALAGSEQAGAANNAAALQAKEAQNALNFQESMFNQQQSNIAPWIRSGGGALNNLDYLLGIGNPNPNGSPLPGPAQMGQFTGAGTPGSPAFPTGVAGTPAPRIGGAPLPGAPPEIGGVNPLPGTTPGVNTSLGAFGSLMQPWNQTFQAPTAAQAAQFPGYQFQLQQGENALQNSAAARGDLLSGGELAAQQQYGQGLAQSDYQNVYNNAMQQYMLGYNQFQQGQTNQFNRLADLAGIGQTSAAQLGNLGQAASGNVANISLGAGQQIGNNINNAGAATASGYAGIANAGIGGLNSITQLALLKQLQGIGYTPGADTSGSIG